MVIKKCFLFLCSCNPYNSKKGGSEIGGLRGTAKHLPSEAFVFFTTLAGKTFFYLFVTSGPNRNKKKREITQHKLHF